MPPLPHRPRYILPLAGALMLAATAPAESQDQLVKKIQPAQHECDVADNRGHRPSCRCQACCGCCDYCIAAMEKVKVEKHCWKIETKKICVPDVVLPWAPGGSGLTCFNWLKKWKPTPYRQDCCGDRCCEKAGCCCEECCCPHPRSGRVIYVRDLKKETYECDQCVCKWEIRQSPCRCTCCNGKRRANANTLRCGDAICQQDPVTQSEQSRRWPEIELKQPRAFTSLSDGQSDADQTAVVNDGRSLRGSIRTATARRRQRNSSPTRQ